MDIANSGSRSLAHISILGHSCVLHLQSVVCCWPFSRGVERAALWCFWRGRACQGYFWLKCPVLLERQSLPVRFVWKRSDFVEKSFCFEWQSLPIRLGALCGITVQRFGGPVAQNGAQMRLRGPLWRNCAAFWRPRGPKTVHSCASGAL